MRLHAALLALLFSGTATSAAEVVQSYDSYKSWLVACDNTLTCLAKGFAEDFVRAELKIERGAGPGGAVSARIAAKLPFALADVRLDGQPLPLAADDRVQESEEGLTAFTASRLEVVRDLTSRLRNGGVLGLGSAGDVPLDGFAAALLRIDDRQGRAGGVTAFYRPGKTAAELVPPAPPLPRIPERPVSAALVPGEGLRLVERVRASESATIKAQGCQEDRVAIETEAYPLDEARALVFIACLMGAYQTSAIAFITPRAEEEPAAGPTTLLRVSTPYFGSEPQYEIQELITEGGFDPDTGTLSMSARGRGLGDCGLSASWIWNGEDFVLSALAMQNSCGGAELFDWQTLFRSKQ